ncbi:MAG: phosphopyruvate hydratase [Elusimicrobiaceae bacterium]|nr:phosphopyruvate hydratase [Elusimicrobiaceae bacterium]
MKTKITKITAREILDSRGFPTVETEVLLADGSVGRAAVPSGASTGSHEALELRDGGKRYNGKGVLKAVRNVARIEKAVKGMDALKIRALDETLLRLDGTANKSKLGANAMLSVSMAALRAGAASKKTALYKHIRAAYSIKEKNYLLPAPMLNIINGGKHADSGLDVQEFMIVPVGAPNFSEALRKAAEIYQQLKKLLASRKMTVSVGDEGGFAPQIRRHEDVLKTIMEAVRNAGYCDKDVKIALDCAASEFCHDGTYVFEGRKCDARQMTATYAEWVKKYPIISIEDPLAEDDWDGWKHLTDKLTSKISIIGDDLFVTNPGRLEEGISRQIANAILIKLNQIGTVTETVDVIKTAHKAGYTCVISHRSGETEDAFIADLAVAANAGAIKTGAPCRSERLCKYNQLLRIENELGAKAKYAKGRVFKAVK